MKKTLISLSLIALSQLSLADQATIDAIETASRTMAISELTQLSQQHSGYDGSLARYRLAMAEYLRGASESAQDQLNQAMTELQTLTEREPDNAEAWALLSHVYGTQITFQPLKSAYYGPKVGSSIAKAKTLAPNNPRVYLVSGISDYFTPAIFGGSKQGAVSKLSEAIKHYAADEGSGYHWGLAEAYVWRGLAKLELGDTPRALDDWQRALEQQPDYPWAQQLAQKHQAH
ncbi:MAG: tetratricopeptide repeat protein [Cellvibrionaceae bacterium]|nr:tetratricopeptide repeat protein [Cellvibrionaceae bacterium]MCV6625652.1 tetratricopeptide repeat protein [Cellvibrionaceae bacterium]